jgi:hypothetical protein
MFRAPISRLFHSGTLLAALVILPTLVASQDRASFPEATVKQVLVRETSGAIEVEIQTSAPVAPNTQAITGPDRIVVDFPGAQPSAQLRKLKVNRGTLKGVRSGLFFSNPPITRVVLDLNGPQAYEILSAGNSTIVKFAKSPSDEQSASAPKTQGSRFTDAALTSRPAHLSEASVAVSGPGRIFSGAQLSSTQPSSVDGEAAATAASDQATTEPTAPTQPPPAPAVTVTYEKGMLSIHADKATLSQVLYEVQLRTQAEIAIPAGAEQEKVVADLGPAPARDVLAQLLNGSAYNFIFVGEELALQRVILTRRAENFSSLP